MLLIAADRKSLIEPLSILEIERITAKISRNFVSQIFQIIIVFFNSEWPLPFQRQPTSLSKHFFCLCRCVDPTIWRQVYYRSSDILYFKANLLNVTYFGNHWTKYHVLCVKCMNRSFHFKPTRRCTTMPLVFFILKTSTINH